MNGLTVGSDAATENGKQTTSRNIFDESEVLKKISWKQWLKQECNKANFSNFLTFLVTVVGLILRITLGKDDLFARCVLSAGLFGFSGGVTNAIAVKMLFDKIYVAPGVSLIGSGIIENKFKEIRTTLKNTMMKSFFVLDYMKGYIERAVSKVFIELDNFLSTAEFEELLSAALEKAMSSEVLKDVPEELRPMCHAFLEDLSQHIGKLQTAAEPDPTNKEDIPSVACLRPHLAQVAQSAAPLLHEQLPRIATSPSVLPFLRKEAEASIRNSIEAEDPPSETSLENSSPWGLRICNQAGNTNDMLNGEGVQDLPEYPRAKTWSTPFKHFLADTAVGYVVNEEFAIRVHRALSKLDVEKLLIAAANSDELTLSVDNYVRSKVGDSSGRADLFGRTLAALQQLLANQSGVQPWPPQIQVCIAKSAVRSVFDSAAPDLQKQVPLLVTESNVHRMRVQIDKLLEERLQGMSKRVVKRMVEDVMRKHCQWLIVWGNIFGGLIGVISTLCGY